MAAERWYEADAERYAFELRQLEEEGFHPVVDEDELARGRVVVSGTLSVDGDQYPLKLVYPDTYPLHKVEAFNCSGRPPLPLHESPEGRLCLIENTAKGWNRDCTGRLLLRRARKLFRTAREGIDALAALGDQSPEPRAEYYPYVNGTSVLIEDRFLEVRGASGSFSLATGGSWAQALLTEVEATEGTREGSSELRRLFRGKKYHGLWTRVDEPPPTHVPATDLVHWIARTHPRFPKQLRTRAGANIDGYPVTLFGVVYRDHGPAGDHDAWLIGFTPPLDARRPGTAEPGALLRPMILSPEEQALRIPALTPLQGKTVAIVGLGTVGAPLALELGRPGLLRELIVVDFDILTIWNLVRHPLDISDLGRLKTDAIADRLARSAPSTKVTPIHAKLGEVAPPGLRRGTMPEAELLNELARADLVIDATADQGTAHILNRLALETGRPLLLASVTDGGWGGEVIRILPARTGCYECWSWWRSEGRYPVAQEPSPQAIFTRGCGFPTFAGSGFDATSIAMDAVRVAVQTLTAGSAGYPDSPYDVVVRDNRDEGPEGGLPSYLHDTLPVHPQCRLHSS